MMRAAAISIILAAGLSAQSTPTFEVASVKIHPDPPHVINISTSGVRLEAEAEMVRGLISWAYDLKNYQVISPAAAYAPVGDTMYDIVAKAEGETPPSRAEFRQMLQTLLADRFRLKFHWETQDQPVYELVVGKNGPKFKPSAPETVRRFNGHFTGRNNECTLTQAPMDDVVAAIANALLDRPVIDRTGLTGTYDVKLTYTPATRANLTGDPNPDDISIFTAVQTQLGLKLEPRTAPIKKLIIDHVEKPAVN